MAYISEPRQIAGAAQLSSPVMRPRAAFRPVAPSAFGADRLSNALEAAMLVATLSGVSLVLSTIAAGAF